MARPKKRPGELGTISFEARGKNILARTRIRLGGGELMPISAVGTTKDAASAALARRANEIWGFVPVRPEATIEVLATSWIHDLWDRVEANPGNSGIREQTVEQYEITVRSTIKPELWHVRVEDVTVAFANAFLRRISRAKSPATANRARNVLCQMFDLAIRHGAIDQQLNPVRGTERFRKSPTIYVEYDTGQLVQILSLLSSWDGRSTGQGIVPSANVAAIIDLILLILGSSERIGEPLALRYEDVRAEVTIDSKGEERISTFIYVGGTMIRTKRRGLHRQDSPKSETQKRWIELPGFAARVVRRRVANYVENRDLNPDGVLFVNRSGRPFDRQNLMRLLRSFRSRFHDELTSAGIDAESLAFKSFRKTVATALADEVGIERAAGLLGHSHSKVTAAHYARPRVPVIREAEALERAFGEIGR